MKVVIGQKDRARDVRLAAILLGVLLAGATMGGLLEHAYGTISSSPTALVSALSCEKGPTWVISVDNAATPNYYAVAGSGSTTTPCGTLAYATNCQTFTNCTTEASFAALMNAVMASGNEKVVFETGTFVISAALSYSVNNVVWEGQGSATNFTVTRNFNAVPISVTGANWIITQIRLDCFGMTYGNSNAGIQFNGNNNTASFDNVNRCDHGGINFAGNGESGINNILTNSNDDGIILRGLKDRAIDNYIYKTTNHNCISLVSASYSVVEDNTCSYSGSNGIAIENLGSGTNISPLISGNIIIYPANDGIVTYPISSGGIAVSGATLISDNQIIGPLTSTYDGILVNSGSNVQVLNNNINLAANAGIYDASTGSNNVFNNNQIFSAEYGIYVSVTSPILQIENNNIVTTSSYGISINSPALISGAVITGNTVTNPTTYAFFAGGGGSVFTLSMNQVIITSPGANIIGFYLSGTNGGLVEGNNLIGDGSSNRAIYLPGATNTIVSDNYIKGWEWGIDETGAANDNQIVNNNVLNSDVLPIVAVGVGDIIGSNLGYNPTAITTFTAMASVYTYTNYNGYDILWTLTTVGGISAWTCDTITGYSIAAGTAQCMTPPGGTMAITWTVTAPVFKGIPLEG